MGMGGDAHRLEPGALTQRLIVSGRSEVPCRADEIQSGCLAPGFAARSARLWHRSDFLLDGASIQLRAARYDWLGNVHGLPNKHPSAGTIAGVHGTDVVARVH